MFSAKDLLPVLCGSRFRGQSAAGRLLRARRGAALLRRTLSVCLTWVVAVAVSPRVFIFPLPVATLSLLAAGSFPVPMLMSRLEAGSGPSPSSFMPGFALRFYGDITRGRVVTQTTPLFMSWKSTPVVGRADDEVVTRSSLKAGVTSADPASVVVGLRPCLLVLRPGPGLGRAAWWAALLVVDLAFFFAHLVRSG